VLTYFSKGGNLTQKTADGRTPLMLAIRYSYNSSINAYNIEVIKYVLNKKPDISAKDNDGESVLFYGNLFSQINVI
jgi:ankyrin repeat protein